MCSVLPLLEQPISNGTKERVPHELSVCPLVHANYIWGSHTIARQWEKWQ